MAKWLNNFTNKYTLNKSNNVFPSFIKYCFLNSNVTRGYIFAKILTFHFEEFRDKKSYFMSEGIVQSGESNSKIKHAFES